MNRRYLAFDLEIAALLPEGCTDWKEYRPLGITCAAMAWQDGDEIKTQTYCSEGENSFAPRMTVTDCKALVHQLNRAVHKGFTILTWNGLSFDFDVLAEESGMHSDCVYLAQNHVDMMFQVFCEKGFPLALNTAAQGMKVQGKTEGMSGAQAPQMWAEGGYQEVLDYCAQDVKCTLELALAVEKYRRLTWIAKSGRRNLLSVPQWLTVAEALQIPEPDNSWMSNPWPRSRFTEWMFQSTLPQGERPGHARGMER